MFVIGSNRNISGSPFEPFGESNLAMHEVISYSWVEASVNSLFLRATLQSAINSLTQLGREQVQPSLDTDEICSVTGKPRIQLIL